MNNFQKDKDTRRAGIGIDRHSNLMLKEKELHQI